MRRILLIFLAVILIPLGVLADGLKPLSPDKAFTFSTYLDKDNQLIAEWNIAPGYYLYRNQLNFTLAPTSKIKIGTIVIPESKDKRQGHEIFSGVVKVSVPILNPTEGLLSMNVGYQGCSGEGFCYTPIKKNLVVDLSRLKGPVNLTVYLQSAGAVSAANKVNPDFAARFFAGQNIFFIILSFLGLGVLLAFTPCVLPMVPILSGIIIGQGKKENKVKPFGLSLAYVLGMAITYAVAGVVVALLGGSVTAGLQKPWVIVLFSGVFVLLALSLFGLYELQLPRRWQQTLIALSNRQRGGTYFGVFMMGALSTLIVSPCVSAPLVGVLGFIGQTGDVVLGASALLALGVGMGVPLLLLGMSAHRLLPKSGRWMQVVERLFGLMMLALAIWMLSRMIPGPVALFLWALLLIGAAIFIEVYFQLSQNKWLERSVSVAALTYGVILIVGSLFGNSDPFHPWEFDATFSKKQNTSQIFVVVQDREQLNQALALAKSTHQLVMLDFYADWCFACKVLDSKVFKRNDVKQALASFVVLRADITQNNAFDQELLKRFHVIGPPTILFFDNFGDELVQRRIVGEVSAKEFLIELNKIKEAP